MNYEQIISQIQNCQITDENEFDTFIDDIAMAVDELNLAVAQKGQVIGLLLSNIESQPNPEFTSWSLIHFIEGLDEDDTTDYNRQLLHSLKRRPRFLTLLLVNRILNGLPVSAGYRKVFLTELNQIVLNDAFDEHVRNAANEFYNYQLADQP